MENGNGVDMKTLAKFWPYLYAECGKVKDKQVSHIKCLIEGALLRELGEKQLAIEVKPVIDYS